MEEVTNVRTPEEYQSEIMKLNYELNAAKSKLAQASQIINQLSDERGIARLNLLFKMLKYNSYFGSDTTTKVVEEINMAMFPLLEDANTEVVNE